MIEKLRAAGFKCTAYMGMIYIEDCGTNIAAYFDYSNELHIECSSPNQPPEWLENRCKMVKFSILSRMKQHNLCDNPYGSWREVQL